MKKEIRSIYEESEIRASNDSRKVEGYGIIFDKESRDLGGWTEIILSGATKGVVKRSDVLALMNHDISRGVLARCTKGKGSMSLSSDTKGMMYSFKAPDTQLGDELIEGIIRKDIKGSSFAFTVAKEGEKWQRKDDGSVLRIISQFKELYDMSPCYREAYQDTTIALRSLEEYNKNNAELEKNKVNPPVAKTPDEILAENKSIPAYSNVELAMRARNEMFKQNI